MLVKGVKMMLPLFALLTIFLPHDAFAQNNGATTPAVWTIEVKGLVTENDRRLPGAVITVYAGGSTVNTINSPDGRFDFQLNPDIDYIITFSKPGYITKRISFSTKNIPEERGKIGFLPYNIEEVDIFPEIPGTDVDQILQQPIAKIVYNQKYHNGDFNFDEKYTESIQSVLDKILAAKRALDAQYKSLITRADGEFNRHEYESAKTDYTSASKLKSYEQYPKDQLAAIEKALAELKKKQEEDAKKHAGQAALQAKYDSIIKIADAAFASKNYKDAKPAYRNASEVFPDKKYPKDQLAAIDKAIADATGNAQKAAQQAKYDSIIKLADAAFTARKYKNAKPLYNSALGVFPDKKYPKDQLKACDKAIADENENAQRAGQQGKYDSLIRLADAAFSKKKYEEAKKNYTSALGISPKKYPKDQIVLIDKTLSAEDSKAKAARSQAQFDSLVKAGDAAYKTKKYEDAKSAYTAALELKPGKPYPTQQLALVEKILAVKNASKDKINKQKAEQAQYDSIVKLADAAFAAKDYSTAKDDYNSALSVKPGRPYPRQQINAIERLLAAKDKKPPVKKDSIVKKVPDTAKKEATGPVVTVCPCLINKLTDSCRLRLKPFIYDATNALHVPLKDAPQEKEVEIPGFTKQRYRIIINISSMPPGTVANVYDEDKTHKKRRPLYSLTDDTDSRIGFIDSDCKTGKFFIDYQIPARDVDSAPQGCAVILFGYESR